MPKNLLQQIRCTEILRAYGAQDDRVTWAACVRELLDFRSSQAYAHSERASKQMNERTKLTVFTLIGFLTAAVIGLVVALVLTLNKDEKQRIKFVPEKITVTKTKHITTTTTTSQESQSSSSYGFDSPAPAGRNYGLRNYGASQFKSETVAYSHSDPSYALVSYFEGNDPIAVWVKKQDNGKWIGVAGTTEVKQAPSGYGIPQDIRYPFSEYD